MPHLKSASCLAKKKSQALQLFPFSLIKVMLNLIKDRDSDPFDMEEPDPSKCRAIDSCLWEIQSLTNHVLPQVAQSAKALMKKLPEMEFDLSEFLEFGMDEMFHVEARKKIFVNVPLTFERPAGMKFAKMDLTGKYFQMC